MKKIYVFHDVKRHNKQTEIQEAVRGTGQKQTRN